MSDLACLQARMARALLVGDFDGVEALIAPGPIAPGEALDLHRNTAIHSLIHALRLSHPTVNVLVGEAFFDQTALAYILQTPPAAACVSDYGAGFAAFLGTYEPAGALSYLADVARLDAAIEAVAGDLCGQAGVRLDLGELDLVLDASLRVLDLTYPAQAIRDAVETDEDDLARIDMSPRPHAVALWRREAGAALRPLAPLAAQFLRALIEGRDPEAAGDDLSSLQSDVFAAPFARLSAKSAQKDRS